MMQLIIGSIYVVFLFELVQSVSCRLYDIDCFSNVDNFSRALCTNVGFIILSVPHVWMWILWYTCSWYSRLCQRGVCDLCMTWY